jgi:DNA-binding protein
MNESTEERNDNTVFVGRKETMAYVLAVVTRFSSGGKIVKIKARGKAISRAVDVAEIVRQRFVTDANVSDIQISTEEIQDEQGTMRVSSIEITLEKI